MPAGVTGPAAPNAQDVTASTGTEDRKHVTAEQERVALYCRASGKKKTHTADRDEYQQRPEIQEARLRELCARRGWTVVAVYTDRATGRNDNRPELQRLMADARRGMFDVVAVAAFDRFARSVKHLVNALDEFRVLRIDFVSLREAIDTSTPMGKAMFTVVAAMSELESSLIAERTAAAMHYAQTHGTRSGRAIGRPRVVFDREEARRMKLEQRMSYRQIGKALGVSPAKIHAALKEYKPGRSKTGSPSPADSALVDKAEQEVCQ